MLQFHLGLVCAFDTSDSGRPRLGNGVDIATTDVDKTDFGNFKGYQKSHLDIMHLTLRDGRTVDLEYETGLASMAPIYYFGASLVSAEQADSE